jgi:hypothetical protein
VCPFTINQGSLIAVAPPQAVGSHEHVFDLENRRVNCVVHASAFSLVSSQLICYLASKVANQKVPAGFFKVDHSSRAIQATMIPVRRDSTWLRVRTAVGRGERMLSVHFILSPLFLLAGV